MRTVLRVVLLGGVSLAALAAACSDEDENPTTPGDAGSDLGQTSPDTGAPGDGSTVDQEPPPDGDVDAGPKCKTTSCARAIAAGPFHTCALLGDETVRCWGDNAKGELGGGTLDAGKMVPAVSATLVPVAGITGAVALAAGGDNAAAHGGFSCAILSTGGLHCWGGNSVGQLGGGADASFSATGGLVAADAAAAAVELGWRHGCFLDTSGALRCWGTSTNRERGDAGLLGAVSLPTDAGLVGLSMGYFSSCVVTGAGEVICFGLNQTGQTNPASAAATTFPTAIDAGGFVTGVSAGLGYTCASLDGGVACWGNNAQSQLGRSGLAGSQPPGSPAFTPGIAPATVTAGGTHACAIMEDRGVSCWGGNAKGQSGDFTLKATVTAPFGVGGIAKAASLALGQEHSCVLNEDGDIYCWGSNTKGQLGPSANADAGADNTAHPDPIKVPL